MLDYGLAEDYHFDPGFDFELRDYDESFPHGVSIGCMLDFPKEYHPEIGLKTEVKE